jgi:hypothetical protein
MCPCFRRFHLFFVLGDRTQRRLTLSSKQVCQLLLDFNPVEKFMLKGGTLASAGGPR